jgi:YD repeat-containing protein
MTQSYTTQTPNFISSGSSDVDPRTRLFSFDCTFSSVNANNGMGPEFGITVGYNPTTSNNYWQLGIGMAYNLTMYVKTTGDLILSSGESYKVNDTGSSPQILQQKMTSVKFVRVSSQQYRVTERNGTVTFLKDFFNNGMFYPEKIATPLGRVLTLNWQNSNMGLVLTSIIDDDNVTYCSVSYASSKTTLVFYPNKPESFTITLNMLNGYLNTIIHSQLGSNAPWTLKYQDVGMGNNLTTLTEITTPTGLRKTAIYNYGQKTGLMRFPPSAGLPPLPAVTQLTVSPGQGQPDMVTQYSATENSSDATNAFPNYLGYAYNYGSGWNKNSDYLYGMFDPNYTYRTYVSQPGINGSAPIKTTYIYNNYHLLKSTETLQGNTRHLVDMKYYLDDYPNRDFNALPTQYQFPKRQSESWSLSGATFKQNTSYEYDTNGNLTKQIDLCDDNGNAAAYSTVTTSEFYSAQGEGTSSDQTTGCPADPNGFVRWTKRQVVTPPVINGYSVPVRTTLYRYKSVATRSGMPVSTAVLPAQETHKASDVASSTQNLLTRVVSYDENTGSATFGRPVQQKATIFDNSGNGYTQQLDYTWAQDSNTITETQKLTTHDNHATVTSESRSRFTEQVMTATDVLGNVMKMTYDSMGRPLTRTANPGTEYESKETWQYNLIASGGTVSSIATLYTDPKGNSQQVRYDGMGRPSQQWRNLQDIGKPTDWRTVAYHYWDAWGRQNEIVENDYADPNQANASYSVKTQGQYDDWGQLIKSTYSSGQNISDVWDPINRNKKSQLLSAVGDVHLGSVRVDVDSRDLPVKQTLLDKNGNTYATTHKEYDGLGRVRKETDPLNRVTTYTYDPFDRVSSKTLPGGAVQSWAYAPFSHEALQTTVSLNGRVMGSQTFDGLGRKTQFTCGGRTEKASYSGVNTVPDTTTNAANQQQTYSYIKPLGNALKTLTGSKVTQNFTYENSTGRLLTAGENGSQSSSYSWLPSGGLQQESMSNQGTSRNARYTWTLQGKPLTYTDVAGNTTTMAYDQYGRVTSITDPQVQVLISRDTAGRVTNQMVKSLHSSDSMSTSLTLDEFGRETRREIAPNSGDRMVIEQTYYVNNQLQSRTVLLGTKTLRKENYAYDERNRLVKQTCSGSELPVDGYGQAYTQLDFVLDVYSNITSCVTGLSNGQKDTCTYHYDNANDPCQLTSVTHTLTSVYPANISLAYDANGRMIKDEEGRTLSYDESGRLVSISGSDGSSTYGYDAFDQLVWQKLNNNETRQLYYLGSRLMNEVCPEKNKNSRYIPGAWGTSAVSDENLN